MIMAALILKASLLLLLPGRVAVAHLRLAAGAQRREGGVDEQEAVEVAGLAEGRLAIRAERSVRPLGSFQLTPLLPRGDTPQQERLRLVDHGGLPRADELPAVNAVERLTTLGHLLEVAAGATGLDRHLLVGVDLTLHAVGAELL